MTTPYAPYTTNLLFEHIGISPFKAITICIIIKNRVIISAVTPRLRKPKRTGFSSSFSRY